VDTRPGLRDAIGPVGIWASLDAIPVDEALRFAAAVEDLGLPTLWVNESAGREPFAVLGALARATSRLNLGLGIASIYARDAAAAHAGEARRVLDSAAAAAITAPTCSAAGSPPRRSTRSPTPSSMPSWQPATRTTSGRGSPRCRLPEPTTWR
jgi:hypothetical protein